MIYILKYFSNMLYQYYFIIFSPPLPGVSCTLIYIICIIYIYIYVVPDKIQFECDSNAFFLWIMLEKHRSIDSKFSDKMGFSQPDVRFNKSNRVAKTTHQPQMSYKEMEIASFFSLPRYEVFIIQMLPCTRPYHLLNLPLILF